MEIRNLKKPFRDGRPGLASMAGPPKMPPFPLPLWAAILIIAGSLSILWPEAKAALSQETLDQPTGQAEVYDYLDPLENEAIPEVGLLEESLDALKAGFEKEITGVKEQNRISALAVRASSLTWAQAVSAMDPETYGSYYQDRLNWLDSFWNDPAITWPKRETYALRLYNDTLPILITLLASRENNKQAMQEVASIIGDPGKSISKAKTKPAQEAEGKAYWSNRLAAFIAIMVRLEAPEKAKELEDLTEDMLNRAEIIALRRDVHYQARLDLMYLNNAYGIASMLFLLAKSEKSPIILEASEVEAAWQAHVDEAGGQVSDRISLTWVTNAQLSFPLAYWLAAGD